MMMTDNIAHFLNKFCGGAKLFQYCPRYRRAFLLLIMSFIALVFALCFLDAYVMQKGGNQDHRHITLFLFNHLFCMARNF